MSNRVFAYVGLSRPYRFERAISALLTWPWALAVLLAAGWLAAIDELRPRSVRGLLFPLLAGAARLGVALVRWPRLAALLLVLAAIEFGWGVGSYVLERAGLGDRVPAAAGHRRSRSASSGIPCCRPCRFPRSGSPARRGLRSATPRRARAGAIPRRAAWRAATSWRPSAARRPTTSAPARATPGATGWPRRWARAGSLLRRQSRRAGLHHRRAADPDRVLPDQVRQAAALRDLLCRLERPAQFAHCRSRSGLCRLPPAEPGRFAQDPPGRRLARHDLAPAHHGDADLERQHRHRPLFHRSLRQGAGERRRSGARGAVRAQRALDLGDQPPARRRHHLGGPASQPRADFRATAAMVGCRWCATATSGRSSRN